jgi:hypothetical protein
MIAPAEHPMFIAELYIVTQSRDVDIYAVL